MKIQEYREYLKTKNIEPDKIEAAVEITLKFNNFIESLDKELNKATYEDFFDFTNLLITRNENSYENFVHLLRLAHYIKNDKLIIAAMEILDGSEMIQNFYDRLETAHGSAVRDQVFEGIAVPPLGIHPRVRPILIMQLINKLELLLGNEKASEFLNNGLRNRYTNWYDSARGTFQEVKNIDKFLDIIRSEFMQNLIEHKKNGTLFFTQPIDDEVIAYVENSKLIESGVRESKILRVAKIPYQTKQFLVDKQKGDRKRMQYHFCHNPWFREGILDDNLQINPIACEISCGYYKDYWEGVLEQPVKVELEESLIRGGDTCSFKIHLPEFV